MPLTGLIGSGCDTVTVLEKSWETVHWTSRHVRTLRAGEGFVHRRGSRNYSRYADEFRLRFDNVLVCRPCLQHQCHGFRWLKQNYCPRIPPVVPQQLNRGTVMGVVGKYEQDLVILSECWHDKRRTRVLNPLRWEGCSGPKATADAGRTGYRK